LVRVEVLGRDLPEERAFACETLVLLLSLIYAKGHPYLTAFNHERGDAL
jgi:hypothetical protein